MSVIVRVIVLHLSVVKAVHKCTQKSGFERRRLPIIDANFVLSSQKSLFYGYQTIKLTHKHFIFNKSSNFYRLTKQKQRKFCRFDCVGHRKNVCDLWSFCFISIQCLFTVKTTQRMCTENYRRFNCVQ